MASENANTPSLDPIDNGMKPEELDDVDMDGTPAVDSAASGHAQPQGQSNGDQQQVEQRDGEQRDGEQQDGEQRDGEQRDGEQRDGEQRDGEQRHDGRQQGTGDGTGQPNKSAGFSLFSLEGLGPVRFGNVDPPHPVGAQTGPQVSGAQDSGAARPTIEEPVNPIDKITDEEPEYYNETSRLWHRIEDCHATIGWAIYNGVTWFLNQYGRLSHAFYRWELRPKTKEYEQNPPPAHNLGIHRASKKPDPVTDKPILKRKDFKGINAVAWFTDWSKIPKDCSSLKEQIMFELEQINPKKLPRGKPLPKIYARGGWHRSPDSEQPMSAWEPKSNFARVQKGKEGKYAMYNAACIFVERYFHQLDHPKSQRIMSRTPSVGLLVTEDGFGEKKRSVNFDFPREKAPKSKRQIATSRRRSSEASSSGTGSGSRVRRSRQNSTAHSQERLVVDSEDSGSESNAPSMQDDVERSDSEWSGNESEYRNNGIYTDSVTKPEKMSENEKLEVFAQKMIFEFKKSRTEQRRDRTEQRREQRRTNDRLQRMESRLDDLEGQPPRRRRR